MELDEQPVLDARGSRDIDTLPDNDASLQKKVRVMGRKVYIYL